ncbi:hypothetical protein A2397_05695 [Candidatus Amesbacteria bacterium RIFOXYB1_FULL_44_23]|uniref:Uncharacterized protein n=1 Tax=Candidatus Amesbacteria bacterium RIFOXYB1_FULL_44_23 TaxID=1797263 RepID=A0A1F4ZPD2_9BACT|nr:MAG: hypothetical protein A2397_05695 [Candidatus Amesbacteria bacterium RIFOXYB1_FULL_44_23]
MGSRHESLEDEKKRDANSHRTAVTDRQFAWENSLMAQQGLTTVYTSRRTPPAGMPRIGTDEYDEWKRKAEQKAQEEVASRGQR